MNDSVSLFVRIVCLRWGWIRGCCVCLQGDDIFQRCKAADWQPNQSNAFAACGRKLYNKQTEKIIVSRDVIFNGADAAQSTKSRSVCLPGASNTATNRIIDGSDSSNESDAKFSEIKN